MDLFHEGDIVVVKPEYSHDLIKSYFSGYSDAKCKFGMAVARGTPAKVAATTIGIFTGTVYLTNLEETLDNADFLHLSSDYFDILMPPIPDGLL